MFNVTVERRKKDGTLKYSGGSVTVNTTCWWDPQRKIPAGIYYGCFATHMSEKKNSQGGPREGIWFPEVPGFSEIFIHMGSSPIWSDG
ncbi:MAG: hypothetical protein OEZ58_16430, partial [Gammaproteobacteria bacterium]|nr:hypothetical protein [Gammaproteobacteria bacterium]